MAERETSRGRRSGGRSEAEKKRREAEALSAEQKRASLLDDPAHPDQASSRRGAAYFAAVLGIALVLNIALMLLIGGGR